MAEEYKYYAFISYKREDEKQAKWLQNKLEHYKLPTVVRTENPSLPETIYPIFRDTTDLSGGFLAGAIEDALKSSKYLIVVCSPRAAQSQWVCKEVQYFIDSGREKYIIPFIIDGEPNSKNIAEECFPENLRNLSGEKEILGINISEMGRDAAAIKVVARMFDLRFDTLWQRYERSKKIKRIQLYCLSLLVAIIGLVVGAIFIYQNGQISNKNVEIQNQNKLLEIKNDSLKIAFLNLAKAKEDIEQRNQALTKSRDSIISINSKLIESNIFLDIERKNVTKKTIEVLKEQMKLVAEQAESMYQDGRVFPAYNYIKPFAEKIINKEYPYSPQIASLINKIKWHLSNEGFKVVNRAYTTSSCGDDTIFVSPNLRYNVYEEKGRIYLRDLWHATETLLPGSGILCDVQFGNNMLFYRGPFDGKLWHITDNKLVGDVNWNGRDWGYKLEDVLNYNVVSVDDLIYKYNIKNMRFVDVNNEFFYVYDIDVFKEEITKEMILSASQNEILLDGKLYFRVSLFNKDDYVETNLKPIKNIIKEEINDTLNYKGVRYELISKKNNKKLFWHRNEFEEKTLLFNDMSKNNFIELYPFSNYNMGNGIEYLDNAFIISNDEILYVAGQGNHVVHNLVSNEIREFKSRNRVSSSHVGEYLVGSILLNNDILCDIRLCGQITLYHIPTGLVIDEYDTNTEYFFIENQLNAIIKIGNQTLCFVFENNKYYMFEIQGRYESLKSDIKHIEDFLYNSKYNDFDR